MQTCGCLEQPSVLFPSSPILPCPSLLPAPSPGATQTMQLPPGVTQEQVQAAFTQMQNMFQQVAQGGAMPTMVPGALRLCC